MGSCVFRFLNERAASGDKDLIFFPIIARASRKISSWYLIKCHTQNEGDSAQSLIERQVKRQLKGGPMYTPESFIAAIRAAKKNWKVTESTEQWFEDFFDIKALANEKRPLNMSQIKIATVKVLRVERGSSTYLFLNFLWGWQL